MHYGFFLAVKLLSNGNLTEQINLVAAFVIVMHFYIMLTDVLVGGGIIAYDKLILKDKVVTDRKTLGEDYEL